MVSEVRDVGVVGVNEMVGVVLWDLKRYILPTSFHINLKESPSESVSSVIYRVAALHWLKQLSGAQFA